MAHFFFVLYRYTCQVCVRTWCATIYRSVQPSLYCVFRLIVMVTCPLVVCWSRLTTSSDDKVMLIKNLLGFPNTGGVIYLPASREHTVLLDKATLNNRKLHMDSYPLYGLLRWSHLHLGLHDI